MTARILCLLGLALGCWSCTCEDELPIVSIESPTLDIFIVTDVAYDIFDGQSIVRIDFNRELDGMSIVPNENLFIEGENVDFFNQVFVTGNQVIIFCGNYLCNATRCDLTVRLDGDNLSSAFNERLDGDRNGLPGGVFATTLVVDACG